MTIEILIASAFIMLASLAGVIFVWLKLDNLVKNNLVYLATFSIGIFAVITYSLFEETKHLGLNLVELISLVVASFAILELASHLIPEAHHHHEIEHSHTHNQVDARRMILSDAIHNIGDGLLLVPAFLASPLFGFSATLGIFLHEVVQGISEFFVMREAGLGAKKALFINLFTSSTILIGVVLSLYLASTEKLIAPLVALSAGGFFYVIVRDLIPHTTKNIRRHGNTKWHILALACGLALMIGFNTIFPH
ncbi:MAG: hypothetical protein A2571_01050 [Candidatus Vogelbacteria bacterium RIFOXYD1_FULL_44_32]|uniref:ZIP family metal transporter n=1 Tax=Candidatus Vogelbacteria bacterium RIFOXYD1_FULL_44_32 TaxID=1802438 RepID=A0A1G2QED4_9BACT|nr:MAG: hypothetical protein A2571_01050 [Candidatus Vogelbacteria bacterium RIFOXYD1_FULL_44_32]